MTLSKVKNKLSNVFQLLERTDLSATGEADNSIVEQVDLDLATIYPHKVDTVTPHIAYLYNTRMGWVQMGETPANAFDTTPVNVMYTSGNNFGIYNLENCSRANGLITCEYLISSIYSKRTNYGHNYKFDKIKELYTFGRINGIGYEIFNTIIANNLGGAINNGFNLNKVYLKQTYASAICIDSDKVLHRANDITVKINPLRTINSRTNQVIGSSNEYINMTGVMTVLIYSDKLVYIRHDGLNFTYKIYSYPNLSLIKTGTESSLRDIYIKNNITREGLIGPTGSGYSVGETSYGPIFNNKGFILNYQQTGSVRDGNRRYSNLQVIDLYNIVGPMIVITNDFVGGANQATTCIYYL